MAEKDVITMNRKELLRLHVIRQVLEKKLKQTEAAIKLELSYRQIKRLVKRIRAEGDLGIIHRLRGRISVRRFADKFRDKILNLCRGKYRNCGPTFTVENLLDLEKIKVSDETLRKWLLAEGLWQKQRKNRKYRSRRPRKESFGEMIQWDGSVHDWFEGRGPRCVLISQIDDATGIKSGQFYEYEGTKPSFKSLKLYIKKYGIPHSIYLDKHTTYKSPAKPTIEDELNNVDHLSEFARGAKELGVLVIYADSPQAKGRIERSFKTDQDRLVKHLRIRGICTIEAANKFLNSKYWKKHNKKFSIEPLKAGDLHRPVPKGMDLDGILCIKDERCLRNDFTVLYKGIFYQVLERCPGQKVVVEERMNGAMFITYKGKRLKYKKLPSRPVAEEPEHRIVIKRIARPSMDHPLKRAMFERMARKRAMAVGGN